MSSAKTSNDRVPYRVRFAARQMSKRELAIPSGNAVELWLATLSLDEDPTESDLAILSRDEARRVGQMATTPRRRFVGARALLRRLLARYLDRNPRSIRFTYEPSGKPRLAGPAASAGLRFSLSHSGNLALFGFSGADLGVDLEEIRPLRDQKRLEARLFSPAEVDWLEEMPPKARLDAFFGLWTLKEAYVKALGTGIATSLSAFEVACPPSLEAAVRLRDGPLVEDCALRCIEPRKGLVAALAMRGRLDTLHCWRLR